MVGVFKFESSLQLLRLVVRKLVEVKRSWDSRLRQSCVKFGETKTVEQ